MAERCLPITRCKYIGSRRLVPAHSLTRSQRRNKVSEPHFCGAHTLTPAERSYSSFGPNWRGQFEEVAEPRGDFKMVTKNRLTASRGRTPRVPMRAEARLLMSKVARVAGRRRYNRRLIFFYLLINFDWETAKNENAQRSAHSARPKKRTGTALAPLLMCGKNICHFEEGCQHSAAVSGTNRLLLLCTSSLLKHTPTCQACSQEGGGNIVHVCQYAAHLREMKREGRGVGYIQKGDGFRGYNTHISLHRHTQPDYTGCVTYRLVWGDSLNMWSHRKWQLSSVCALLTCTCSG